MRPANASGPDRVIFTLFGDGHSGHEQHTAAVVALDDLAAVQTPQVFEASLLKAALQSALEAGVQLTDDCSAVERLGKVVYLVEGSEENLKITTPTDLILAEAILRDREDRT